MYRYLADHACILIAPPRRSWIGAGRILLNLNLNLNRFVLLVFKFEFKFKCPRLGT
eukprot:SAG31_NODE_13646_length_855_cov_1.933862_1_plen_55_part_10